MPERSLSPQRLAYLRAQKRRRRVVLVLQVLLHVNSSTVSGALMKVFSWAGSLSGRGLVLAAVLLVLTNYVKQTKKLHPIVFIGLSAVVGILFYFGGM